GPVDVSTPRAAPGTDRASSAAPERADRAERDGAAIPHGSPGVGSSPAAGEADAASAEAESEPERTPVVWAEPTEPSPVEPVPMEARVPKPEAVRGIYVGAWSVGSPGRLEQLIALADETEINAFVIDVKDVTGEVSHASRVPLARQIGATPQVKIADLRGTLARLREHGIYPIARIVVFKDPLLATARPEWAIERDDGTIWEDNTGVPWVDSYNRNVWEYNIELAREAVALGFSEIQWDYIRFPDVPGSYLVEAVYPAQEGRSKTAAIREFMAYTRERLADLEVPVTADVFGITTSTRLDIGIGQVWEEMSDVVDVLLPMVYPSHYPDGSWEYENPNAAPYQIVKRAMDDAVARSLLIDGAAAIRPWLQAFSMGEPAYGPRHVRAQIDAVYDAGLREWILWSPGVRYNREALASESGVEPWFAGMGELLYEEGLPSGPAVDEPLGSPADTVGSGR
ncbi:MAG: putative glycoside hydrolase, partial [Gemmatimonadota bacterium]